MTERYREIELSEATLKATFKLFDKLTENMLLDVGFDEGEIADLEELYRESALAIEELELEASFEQ